MLVLLLCFAVIAFFDLVPLIRQKQRNAGAAFSFLFLFALVIAVLLSLGVRVPSSMLFLGDVLESIGLSY